MALASYPINKRFGYPFVTGTPALAAITSMQLRMHSIACVNGSGSSADIGIGYTLGLANADVFTASGGAATAYASGAYLATIGDQLYFQSDSNSVSDFISFKNSVLASGGTPTYTYEYWNGAWTALTPQSAPDFTNASAGLIIGAPLDWIAGAGGVSGLDDMKFTFRINATAVSTTPAQASEIYVCKLLIYRESIEAKQALEVNFENFGQQFLMSQGQMIMPFFSTADIDNSIELGYRQNP